MLKFKVPKTWFVTRLGDVAEVQTGLALNSNQQDRQSDNPVRLPYLRVANVQDGHLDLFEIKYIDIPKDKVSRYLLQKDDVLMTEGGDFDKLGRGTIWKDEIPNCIHQNHIFVVRTQQDKLLPYYLECISGSHIGRTYFLNCSKQTTNLASVNSTQLKHMPLALPPLPEQKKIAEILLTWDTAMERTERLIAAKKKLKKALIQQLLTGKKRFKEFKGLNWKYLKADEIFKSHSEKNNGDEELLSVTQDRGVIPRHMLEGKVVMPEGSTDGYKLAVPGDFIISLRSFQGGLEYSDYRGLVSPAYTVLKPKIIIDPAFYMHYFKSFNFVGHLAVAVIGIRDGKQVSYDDFAFLKLPFPSIEEQGKIASVLNTTDQEIDLSQTQLEALKQQKKGLMQQLLTGKIRVEV